MTDKFSTERASSPGCRQAPRSTYAARSTTMILTYLFCDCEHRVNMVYTISFQSYYACVSSSWLIYACLCTPLFTLCTPLFTLRTPCSPCVHHCSPCVYPCSPCVHRCSLCVRRSPCVHHCVHRRSPLFTGVHPVYIGVHPMYTGVHPVYIAVHPVYTGVHPRPFHGAPPQSPAALTEIRYTPAQGDPFVPQLLPGDFLQKLHSRQ